ncbi:MAG: hypothetical protein ABI702_03535 [Burkholderiales bacterium]
MFELELTGEHVAMLGDEDLRTLVVKLCEAELRRTGRPSSAVLAGGNQTAPDGGVDVRVQLEATDGGTTTAASPQRPPLKGPASRAALDSEAPSPSCDFILRPETGFQVKCENMPVGAITAEMRPKGVLRNCLKDLIARKGAYVIVSSKGTVADVYLAKRIQAMRDAVADQPSHSDLKLDFFDRDRLARWVRQYPGVELWLRERVNARLQGWQGYGCWAGPDVPYLLDDTARLVERTGGGAAKALSVTEGLARLRAALSKPGQVLRVVGLSGTGKTRMVQALFEKEVGSGELPDQAFVLYTDLGNEPDPSAREMLLRLGSKEQRAIVIVDNCNPKTHRTLADVVSQYNKHLSLLTVEYDVADDDSPDATDVYELAPASAQVLEGILLRLMPHLTGPDRQRITEFSGGNARVALALARTVAKGEGLGVLNDTELFRRLFRQGQAEDPELLRAAQVCSLVYSFEVEDMKSESSELRVLARLAEMTPNELYRHVSSLKRRDLVQSRSKWRAVLPPALANRLAQWALQEIPAADITDAFAVSERLLISFSRRLEYLHDSEEACAIAGHWMEDERWLADPAQLNELGRKLFINLAPLVPDKVLAGMERALSSCSAANFVLRHKHSMHEWSTLLRHLAYQPESFDRAAALLLTLAEHEESNNVDCRGAWKEMFRIGLSGTLAPPAQRVRLLEHLLTTATGKRREITWTAVEAMLEANHISSSHDFSFGARPHGYGWEPESHAEVLAWFESAIALLRREAASGDQGLQRVRTALAAHFREVWACGVDDQLKALMLEVAGRSGWPGGWVATRSTLRFDSKQMAPETLRALNELDAAIAPKGLAQEVRAYALEHAGGLLDVADAVDESDENEDKNPVTSWERVNERVVDLGTALAADDAALEQVLTELLAQESGRQNYLGQGLGQGTHDAQRHWQMLHDAFVELPGEPNVSLLAGFVRGLRNKEPKNAVVIMDSVVGDDKLDVYYPDLLGAPRDDADGDRLIASMKRANARAHRYVLSISHGDDGGLSVAKFCEAMQVLSTMENGLIAAIDDLGTERHRWNERRADISPELVLLARTLLASFTFESRNHNVGRRVNELAKLAFVGPLAVEAAAQFAARFAAALNDYSHGEDFGDLACTLFKLQPLVALDAFLSKPNPKRHLGFRARFIARHGPIVQCAPEEMLLQWVGAAPGARAPVVAREVELFEKPTKKTASALEDSPSGATLSAVAARLLELAPDKAAVLQGFSSHFHPSHWSGSLAQTLAPHLLLVESLVGHADSVVVAWAQEALKVMRQRIEHDRSTDIIREQSFE